MPQSVRDEGWQAWEAELMQREDANAPRPATRHEDSDSEMSCLSVADSSTTRRRKLDSMVRGITSNHVEHLRCIKRRAQKAAHNSRCRSNSKPTHIDDMLSDVSAVLSWHTHQTRDADGKFGRLHIH